MDEFHLRREPSRPCYVRRRDGVGRGARPVCSVGAEVVRGPAPAATARAGPGLRRVRRGAGAPCRAPRGRVGRVDREDQGHRGPTAGVRDGRARRVLRARRCVCAGVPAGVPPPAGRLHAARHPDDRAARAGGRPGRGVRTRGQAGGGAAARGADLERPVRRARPPAAAPAVLRTAAGPRGRQSLAAAAGRRGQDADRPDRRGGWLESQAPDHQIRPADRPRSEDGGPPDPLRPSAAGAGPTRAAWLGTHRGRGRIRGPVPPDPRLPHLHRRDARPVPRTVSVRDRGEPLPDSWPSASSARCKKARGPGRAQRRAGDGRGRPGRRCSGKGDRRCRPSSTTNPTRSGVPPRAACWR